MILGNLASARYTDDAKDHRDVYMQRAVVAALRMATRALQYLMYAIALCVYEYVNTGACSKCALTCIA
jgi:hypothetical protein